jgi:hypothetical protein
MRTESKTRTSNRIYSPPSPEGELMETLLVIPLRFLYHPHSPPSPEGELMETIFVPLVLLPELLRSSPPSPEGELMETLIISSITF